MYYARRCFFLKKNDIINLYDITKIYFLCIIKSNEKSSKLLRSSRLQGAGVRKSPLGFGLMG